MIIELSRKNLMEQKIKDIMEYTKPLLLKESVSVKKAVALLREKSAGAILIVNDENKLSGIFTERDFTSKVDFSSRGWQKHCLKDYMTPDPFFITENDLLCDLVNNMSVGHYRHMPMVSQRGEPIGLISIKDLFPLMVDALGNSEGEEASEEFPMDLAS